MYERTYEITSRLGTDLDVAKLVQHAVKKLQLSHDARSGNNADDTKRRTLDY